MSPQSWARTAPASLEMVSGGVLAEWLLTASSGGRSVVTPTLRAAKTMNTPDENLNGRDVQDPNSNNFDGKKVPSFDAHIRSENEGSDEKVTKMRKNSNDKNVISSENLFNDDKMIKSTDAWSKYIKNNSQLSLRLNKKIDSNFKNVSDPNIRIYNPVNLASYSKFKEENGFLPMKLISFFKYDYSDEIENMKHLKFEFEGFDSFETLRSDIETRSRSYLQIINEVMPRKAFHSTLKKSLKRLMFRLRLIGNNDEYFLWISDFLTILILCKKTSFEGIHLNFQTVNFHDINLILSTICYYELERTISKISFPQNQDGTKNGMPKVMNKVFTNISNNLDIKNTCTLLDYFPNLKCMRINSNSSELLMKMRDLPLQTLYLLSDELNNIDIKNNFLGYQNDSILKCEIIECQMIKSLKSLHIPNCQLLLATYSLLVQTLPNVTELQVKPKLFPLTESTQLKSNSTLKYLSLTSDELVLFDIGNSFPMLENLSVHFHNALSPSNLTSIEKLDRLKDVELYSYPCYSNFYSNLKLEHCSNHLENTFQQVTSLTLQNFDISAASFELLSQLPQLSSLTLKSCWLNGSQNNISKQFKSLNKISLNFLPSNSVMNSLFSSGGINHLTIIPDTDANQASHLTEATLKALLSSGKLASLTSLSLASFNLSPAFLQQLTLLPRLQQFSAIDQCGMSGSEMRTCVSRTPAHITLCSDT